jgi:hypothetical protein
MSHNWYPSTLSQLQGNCGKKIPILTAKKFHKNMPSTPYEFPDKRAEKAYRIESGRYSAQPHASRRDKTTDFLNHSITS